ncbi:MAG TPA: alpha-glucan family phosphorylase [Bacteroidales bacterium]|nr:MAG: alpha-glucan phosphorylase [Bacteroidetes bacterium GWF2_33_38]OFY76461.1 MAG: alpha-glucan phosphorylase [Bacteroidetes bacterium RIFOXYA12_FULL_33_9]OFY85136.1 MAG: alpha-glucan phosphorylase [Bacteroidetes bacterium RIFOXYA2_FULL_33_7]HBF89440.1 alpha-glucan family phosphorylase [Bacteroidales bacterium]
MSNSILRPDYLFEVSWETCNKVGGIHTVLSTKANTLTKKFEDQYILIGPDVWKETTENPEFIEDKFIFKLWREHADLQGLKFRVGRWNIIGNPIVILVDFTPYFSIKDQIYAELWENYKLDSLSGQWDYVEPTMFGYAAAKIIESFYDFNLSGKDKIVAQFHEWMTGSGVLYLKKNIPQIGTIFTAHATVLGRSIAGNGLPLYQELKNYNPEDTSKRFNVVAKQSLEKIAANQADCFTTVSDITAKECAQFLGKEVNLITPNGFEDNFVPQGEEFDKKRTYAKNKLHGIAEAVLNQKIDKKNSMFITISGRYEFKNKGIDIFIDSLGKLNTDYDLKKTIVAYILVPANNAGARLDVLERVHNCNYEHPISQDYLTHWIHDEEYDPIIRRINSNNLKNTVNDKVKVIFVPSYLNGTDGIFNLTYFDLLIGFDSTIFPSYYEPWGYTPMESIAFKIPTLTTILSGFGTWIKSSFGILDKCISVINRTDFNDAEVIEDIARQIHSCSMSSAEDKNLARELAYSISRNVLWSNLINYYEKAYSLALEKTIDRQEFYINKQIPIQAYKSVKNNKPNWKKVYVKSNIPDSLVCLYKLARNLWWSWNVDAQEMFEMIDPVLWEKVNKNPIALLEELTYEEFEELEKNKAFIDKMNKAYSLFDKYINEAKNKKGEQIAYFSMEFGMHDSVKIFSGGLGILAGDYLKEASDSNVNLIGVGLLYRYGYFTQSLSPSGDQISNMIPQRFSQIPVKPVKNDKGEWLTVSLALPGRTMLAKVWRVDVGRIPLYLMDTDIDENIEADRSVTHQLYGGDWENRLKQELLLGVGGIRLIEAMKIKPMIYHCNEGHAAFIGVERMRNLVEKSKFSFDEALEIVRSSNLFTTHTPVPAGHDAFDEELLRIYIPHYADKLNITWERFMKLGRADENNSKEKFSMSLLALNLSQEVNGVSRIHGRVSREMFAYLWEGYFSGELYIGHVTNGVHFPTWVNKNWLDLYNKIFGNDFVNKQSDRSLWKKIQHVPDEEIWTIRKKLRKELIDSIKQRLFNNLNARQDSPSVILDIIDSLDENALTIGFARRFATYKRAHLLFKNLKKLAELLNKEGKPIQFIFAGKAHPHDKAGQQLIKNIIDVSRKPEFLGKIVFVENYDMELAKKLVQGVDIWLNTPTRPLEASGTSGEKAIMNGVMNLSVLDGWWAEGYKKGAGWAIKEERTYENQALQDELDAETIYNLLEHEIVPAFYNVDKKGISKEWISHIKNTISEIAPEFTMNRQLIDYYHLFYDKLIARHKLLAKDNYELAKKITAWKKNIIRGWKSIEVISVNLPEASTKPLLLGDKFRAEVVLNLHELSVNDIGMELVFGRKVMDEVTQALWIEKFELIETNKGLSKYVCEFNMKKSGVYDYSLRIFPTNELLPHRQDFNLLRWI